MKQYKMVGFQSVHPDNFAGAQAETNVYTYMLPIVEVSGVLYSPTVPNWQDKDLDLFFGDIEYPVSGMAISEGENVSFVGKKFVNDVIFVSATAGFDSGFDSYALSFWFKTDNGFWMVEPYDKFISRSSLLARKLDDWGVVQHQVGGLSERFAFQAWGLATRIYARWQHFDMERKISLLNLLDKNSQASYLGEINL